MSSYKNQKIYLAGPISGKTGPEVVDYFKSMSETLKGIGFDVASPMTGKDSMRTELKFKAEGYGNPVSSNHAIFERDKWMVQNSNIILCNLSTATERVSIGSMYELAWASYLGKHTIVVMGKENIHRHAFVLEAADVVFETMEEALEYLKTFGE
jgi:nucleoside 2-deoxyribosyltransferase